MHAQLVTSLCALVFQQLVLLKVEARQTCFYRSTNATRVAINCYDDCCSDLAASPETTCCSNISWGSIAIPFFVFTGICVLAVCVVYCRPLWRKCLCGLKCPCGTRSRVTSSVGVPAHTNPVYVLNNDDLPDYDTIIKDSSTKDTIPPPYNFVTSHPGDFGIESRVPSAPPQYHSRRSSLTSTHPTAPTEP